MTRFACGRLMVIEARRGVRAPASLHAPARAQCDQTVETRQNSDGSRRNPLFPSEFGGVDGPLRSKTEVPAGLKEEKRESVERNLVDRIRE